MKIHGDLESRFLLNALNGALKANRRNLLFRVLEVRKECDLRTGRNGLLERHAGAVDANVMEHALHFHLVVQSVPETWTVTGHRISNLFSRMHDSPSISVAAANVCQAVTSASLFTG